MKDGIIISPEPGPDFGTKRESFNFSDSLNPAMMLKESMALQANKLAEHEGKIAGLSAVVSSLQSYKGFLQAAILVLFSFCLAGLALMITLQIRADSKTEATSGKFKPIEDRISNVEGKVDALPGRLSREIRETSRDLVLITQSSANTPPKSATPARP